MAAILVLFHSQEYGNTKKMAEAVAKGVRDAGAEVITVNTNEERVNIEQFRKCDALAAGSPDYYSYIAGGLKIFMDDWYIAKKEGSEGLENKPVAMFYSHGGGGRVKASLEKLFGKIGPKVGETVESKGMPDEGVLGKCEELGRKLAGSV